MLDLQVSVRSQVQKAPKKRIDARGGRPTKAPMDRDRPRTSRDAPHLHASGGSSLATPLTMAHAIYVPRPQRRNCAHFGAVPLKPSLEPWLARSVSLYTRFFCVAKGSHIPVMGSAAFFFFFFFLALGSLQVSSAPSCIRPPSWCGLGITFMPSPSQTPPGRWQIA